MTVAGLSAGLLPACRNTPFTQGKILYENFCANCHMDDGTGLPGIIPPLKQSDFLAEHQSELPCLIRNGIEEPLVVNGRTYRTPMEGIPQLTEFEITNVINYINTAWGNTIPLIKHPDVRTLLVNCP